jgi:hypothetical protein
MAPVEESMSGGLHPRELLPPEHLQLTPLVRHVELTELSAYGSACSP